MDFETAVEILTELGEMGVGQRAEWIAALPASIQREIVEVAFVISGKSVGSLEYYFNGYRD